MKEIDIGIFALHPLAHTPTFGTEGSAGPTCTQSRISTSMRANQRRYAPASHSSSPRVTRCLFIHDLQT